VPDRGTAGFPDTQIQDGWSWRRTLRLSVVVRIVPSFNKSEEIIDNEIRYFTTARGNGGNPRFSPLSTGAAPGLVFVAAQDCWQLKKGETTTIEFVAQMEGTYTFKCCHTCGLGHRGMKGQIVVDP
jgi:hypothetical protein